VCAIVGLVVAIWINLDNITAEVILSGLASGLASTGLHQAFKQLLDGKKGGE
ncbi:MAG: holin, partial [Clostridia bacterium]|nr:holin [Clostridia bacterium]